MFQQFPVILFLCFRFRQPTVLRDDEITVVLRDQAVLPARFIARPEDVEILKHHIIRIGDIDGAVKSPAPLAKNFRVKPVVILRRQAAGDPQRHVPETNVCRPGAAVPEDRSGLADR